MGILDMNRNTTGLANIFLAQVINARSDVLTF